MKAEAGRDTRKGKKKHSIVGTVFRRSLSVYMLNSLAWAIGVLVDGAIIGRHLGVDAMAAYGMIWPLTLIYGLIGGVLSGGSRNLYSNLAGHGKLEEANGVFTLACVTAVLLSVLAAAATVCFASPLAGLLGANGVNENLRPLIVLYLQGIVIGLPFDSMGWILAKDDDLILRVRDDCRPFNLPERYAMTQRQEADPLKNIGIRMVMNAARDVQYLSTMSTNNLIIRI